MVEHRTLTPDYFDAVYAANADPWQFETSAYERAKYAATIDALPERHFDRGFEIGCSIGVLTAMLAARCAELLAVDVSSAALDAARRRLAASPHVALQKMAVPHQFPAGKFDLVMLSEVGYYWSALDLALAAERIVSALRPGGVLALVHWTPVVADYPLTGDAVHTHFLTRCAEDGVLRSLVSQRADTYRIDVLERRADGSP